MFGPIAMNRPFGFSARKACCSVLCSEDFVGKCSRKLLVKTTSRLVFSTAHRSEQSCSKITTSGFACRFASGFKSIPNLSLHAAELMNSHQPQPRSSTAESGGIHREKKCDRTAQTSWRYAALSAKRARYNCSRSSGESSEFIFNHQSCSVSSC